MVFIDFGQIYLMPNWLDMSKKIIHWLTRFLLYIEKCGPQLITVVNSSCLIMALQEIPNFFCRIIVITLNIVDGTHVLCSYMMICWFLLFQSSRRSVNFIVDSSFSRVSLTSSSVTMHQCLPQIRNSSILKPKYCSLSRSRWL